jgi:hypothetical protein
MSNGDIVPDVITTLLNLSKIGLMANEGSRHLTLRRSALPDETGSERAHMRWKMGLGIVALSVSNGSNMSRNPIRFPVGGVEHLS